MKFATSVGMPMPRFTSMPSRSSRAMRLAIRFCASISSFLRNDVIDQRSGSYDMVRRNDADRHDMVRIDNDRIGGCRHQRVEVARRQRVGQVAEVIANQRVNERIVRADRRLQQVLLGRPRKSSACPPRPQFRVPSASARHPGRSRRRGSARPAFPAAQAAPPTHRRSSAAAFRDSGRCGSRSPCEQASRGRACQCRRRAVPCRWQ